MTNTWRTERALWLFLFSLQFILIAILLVVILQSSPLDSRHVFPDNEFPRNLPAESLVSNTQSLDAEQQKLLLNNYSRLQKSFDDYRQFISRGHEKLRELYIVLLLLVASSIFLGAGILFFRVRRNR